MTEDDILNDDLDFILSQVAEEMENEYKCEQDLNNLTISQCITSCMVIFNAITLCFIMFICPFVGPLIWTNKILSYLILSSFRKH